MDLEIERKFLVTSMAFKREAIQKYKIIQGFLCTNKKRTVRVRLKDDQGYLTIKGMSSEDGLSRMEWETEISKNDAENLLKLCKKDIIEKDRFLVKVEDHMFEVDEFKGINHGLVLAEIELNAPDEAIKKPDWLGDEVTGKPQYYNACLSKNPYKLW